MIRARGVRFSFPGRPVLDSLSVDIEESLTTVIIGRSGIGKSVFLKCITGLLTPQEGSITIDGDEVVGAGRKELRDLRRRIGMLFQEGALFDSMSVFENVAFPLVYHKTYGAKEIEKRVMSYLELVSMQEYAEAMPQELSGGMKRKVAVARAMILEPKYLLYDEPTAGLDPITARAIQDLIARLRAELGMTCLVVSHDLEGLFHFVDRAALLYGGKIVASGTPAELRSSGDELVRQFVTGSVAGPIHVV